jgi:serine/threonine-protein kinase
VREIGRGGLAVVYLARDPEGQARAVKTVQFTGTIDGEQLERFQREIQLLASIDDVHVVRFYEAGRLERPGSTTTLWVALEHLEGPTLRKIIDEQGGRLAPDDVARWCKHIAEGVAAAHRLRVIHRDLKPTNVAIVQGVAKVFDFGLANFRQWGVRTTDHRSRLGTLGYMAPEQLRGGVIDERTDVFALGLLLYELASGSHPFLPRGVVVTPGEAMARTINMQARPLHEIAPAVPADLATIAARALEKNPEQRYRTIDEMGSELDVALKRYRALRRPLVLGPMVEEWQVPASLEPPPRAERPAGASPPRRTALMEEAIDEQPVNGVESTAPMTPAVAVAQFGIALCWD